MTKHLALTVVFLCGAAAHAEDAKVDRAKLVGVWTARKGSETVPVGSSLEFTKDGKIKLTIRQGKKSLAVQGTYKIDGSNLKTVLKAGDKEHAETIKIDKLTEKELVTIDEKDKKDVFGKK